MKKSKAIDPIPIVAVERAEERAHWYTIAGKPVVRFAGFLEITQVGRSKAYLKWSRKNLVHYDPDFPVGFPLYDTPRSPKVFWVHEALAWVEARSNKHRN